MATEHRWDVVFKVFPKDIVASFIKSLTGAKDVTIVGPLETVPSRAPFRIDMVATADGDLVLMEYFGDRTPLTERAFYDIVLKAVSLARDRGVNPLEFAERVLVVVMLSSRDCLRERLKRLKFAGGTARISAALRAVIMSLSDVELRGELQLLYVLGKERRAEGLRVALNSRRYDVFSLGLLLLKPEEREWWVKRVMEAEEDAVAETLRIMMKVNPEAFGKALAKGLRELLRSNPKLLISVLRDIVKERPELLNELKGDGSR